MRERMKTFLRRLWLFACYPTVAVFAQETKKKDIAPVSDFDGIIPSTDSQVGSDLTAEGDAKVRELAQRVKDGRLDLADVFIFILKLIDLVTKIAGSIAVIAILYGAIQFMVSGVTDEKEQAKTTLKYAIIGLVVTFGAWLMVNLLLVQLGGSGAVLG